MATTTEALKFKGSEFIRASSGSTCDIMTVLLQPDELYTETEVSEKIQQYLGKEVKK